MNEIAIYPSPIGDLYINCDLKSLLSISFSSNEDSLIDDTPQNNTVMTSAINMLDEYFRSGSVLEKFTDLQGTPFQQKVWRELSKIPLGQTRTYGQIARRVNSPGSSRAVGMACNRNPIAVLIPCHRVVGTRGLTGYAGGLEAKSWLLSHEKELGRH